MVKSNKVLLICDEREIATSLRDKLSGEGDYTVYFENEIQSGLSALKEDIFGIIIIKFGMRDMEGKELVAALRKIDTDSVIIAVVEENQPEVLNEMSRLGVYAYVKKDVSSKELLFLVKRGIELRNALITNRRLIQGLQEQNLSLQKQNTLLARRIEEATQNLTRLYDDLRSTYMRTIRVLAQAIDARDHYTHSHSENVAKIAVTIAQEMGLSVKEIELIRDACELHDLGKIGIEDSILEKPGSLNDEEWEQIRKHPSIAAQILEPLTFLNGAIDLVKQHHEHYDGSGYPEGRHGEDILLGARIVHIADAYEAMRSARSYRKTPLTKEEAVLEIKKNSGKQFDPLVVEAFLRVVDKL